MRILHVSDTHLGLEGAAARYSRAFLRALGPALRGEVDLVVHSGDVFDRSHPPPAAIAAAVSMLRLVARAAPVVMIPGNHDRHGLGRSLPPIPGVTIADVAARVVIGDVALGLVPYHREADAWAAAAREAVGPGVDALVAHQSFDGSRVPGFTFRVGRHAETVGEQHVPPGVRWILAGHLHPRQEVALGAATVVHAGATERTSSREGPEPKGTVLWTFGREVSWEYLGTVAPPARQMRLFGAEDADTA